MKTTTAVTAAIALLLPLASCRFNQENPAVLNEIRNAGAGMGGADAGQLSTFAGQAIGTLLAGADVCAQQDLADNIVDFAKSKNLNGLVDVAKRFRQAERNVNPFANANPCSKFCQKQPRNAELAGLVQAQDPNCNLDAFFAAGNARPPAAGAAPAAAAPAAAANRANNQPAPANNQQNAGGQCSCIGSAVSSMNMAQLQSMMQQVQSAMQTVNQRQNMNQQQQQQQNMNQQQAQNTMNQQRSTSSSSSPSSSTSSQGTCRPSAQQINDFVFSNGAQPGRLVFNEPKRPFAVVGDGTFNGEGAACEHSCNIFGRQDCERRGGANCGNESMACQARCRQCAQVARQVGIVKSA